MGEFLLFAGNDYYPQGGWYDYIASYTRKSDAIKRAIKLRDPANGWWHIVQKGEIVLTSYQYERAGMDIIGDKNV